jgi:predicted regulator of Ras-like GTPase activity (Roadblock/LC7/MglB family)
MGLYDAYQSFERKLARGEYDNPKKPEKPPKQNQPIKKETSSEKQKTELLDQTLGAAPATDQTTMAVETNSAFTDFRNAVGKPVAQFLESLRAFVEPRTPKEEARPLGQAVAPQVVAARPVAQAVTPQVVAARPVAQAVTPQIVAARSVAQAVAPPAVEARPVAQTVAPKVEEIRVGVTKPAPEIQTLINPKLDLMMHEFMTEMGTDLVTTFVSGTDGEMVAAASNDPDFNSKIAAASISLILQLASKAGGKVGLGQVDNNMTSTDKVHIIARFIGDSSYCWGVVVLRNSPLGYIRMIMNQYADKIWSTILTAI